jgi:hypothetical protein
VYGFSYQAWIGFGLSFFVEVFRNVRFDRVTMKNVEFKTVDLFCLLPLQILHRRVEIEKQHYRKKFTPLYLRMIKPKMNGFVNKFFISGNPNGRGRKG